MNMDRNWDNGVALKADARMWLKVLRVAGKWRSE